MKTIYYVIVAAIALGLTSQTPAADPPRAQVLVLVGPSTHPPGTHEVAAGGRLVAYCLEHAENVPGMKATVVTKWPDDRQMLQKVATVVFTGDRFPPA